MQEQKERERLYDDDNTWGQKPYPLFLLFCPCGLNISVSSVGWGVSSFLVKKWQRHTWIPGTLRSLDLLAHLDPCSLGSLDLLAHLDPYTLWHTWIPAQLDPYTLRSLLTWNPGASGTLGSLHNQNPGSFGSIGSLPPHPISNFAKIYKTCS